MKKPTRVIQYASIFLIILMFTLLFVFMPDGLRMTPLTTPSEFLSGRPYLTLFGSLILIVPSSTFFVYLLGVMILLIGLRLYRTNQRLFGISLFFWALGTVLAGSSYQGFGYMLKCLGRDYCLFTSWPELAYLFTTAISIGLLSIAFVQLLAQGKWKKWVTTYSMIAIILYSILLLLGSILENGVLVSYELFSAFFMPLFLVLFIINIQNYKRNHDTLNKYFIRLWLFFLAVNVAYYVYFFLGITETLYSQTAIWFSANDVLHLGLIAWFLYFNVKIVPELIHLKNPSVSNE